MNGTPPGVALVTGLGLLLLGAGSSIPGLVAYTFSAFVLATIVLEFARGTRARKALGAPSWPAAFGSLVSRNRRRYGGYVVHAAIVMLAIGIAGSSAFDRVAEAKLAKGDSMRIGERTICRSSSTAPLKRSTWPTCSTAPVRSAVSKSRRASSTVDALLRFPDRMRSSSRRSSGMRERAL